MIDSSSRIRPMLAKGRLDHSWFAKTSKRNPKPVGEPAQRAGFDIGSVASFLAHEYPSFAFRFDFAYPKDGLRSDDLKKTAVCQRIDQAKDS
jgi:hypothetical protein